MQPMIGEMRMFGGNFAPRGWAFCKGQLLAISQHTALFSILGTTYGGDGRTTFGLPDLRGRAGIGDGTGPGLTNRRLGEQGGSQENVLSANQMAAHTHQTNFDGQGVNAGVSIPAVNDDGTTDETENNILANSAGSYAAASAADTTLGAFSAAVTGTANSSSVGSGAPINNMQPYLAVSYCICIEGIYPPRS